MFFPPKLSTEFFRILKPIWESDQPDHLKLRAIWSILTGCQGAVISQILLSRIGNKVFAGPFRGMELSKDVMKWHFSPSLLGTFEWEIHDAVELAIASGVKHVINIGCAYGYYSVGFARRLPDATIHAYDSDPEMRDHCRAMAELNGVADRIMIGDCFHGEDFERLAGEDVFVFMDIEGGEQELLDPQKFPALTKMNIIVALHDTRVEGLSEKLPARFVDTHNIKIIRNAPFSFPLDKILGPEYVPDHFDNLIATWEARSGPTPFGIFTRK